MGKEEMKSAIVLHEVGMRDGLQIEKRILPTAQKIQWIEKLIASGIDIIQIGSFVHPGKVPQMADTDQLFAHFAKRERQAVFSALVLNERGLERGLSCGVDRFCMGVSASSTHSQRNTGMDTEEAVARIVPMAKQLLSAGRPVQVSVQSAFGCGYEGKIPAQRVLDIVRVFVDAGLRMISLADTAGHAVPAQVEDLFGEVQGLGSSIECTCHFHDTYGLAMANAVAALRAGVKSFEVAFAGLGGCPFTAATGGNLCTEDFLYYLHRTGRRHEVKLAPILEVAAEASTALGRTLPGAVHRIGTIKA